MRPNWHEFGDFLAFAGELDADVFVNTVTWPDHLSLYSLPADELLHVADELEGLGERIVPGHPVLAQEVTRLRNRADPAAPTPWFERWSPVPVTVAAGPRSVDEAFARRRLGAEPDVLVTDADDQVRAVDGPSFLGTRADALVGRSYREALEAAGKRFGPLVLVSDEAVFANGAERFLLYDGPHGQTRVHAITVVEDDLATTYAIEVQEYPLTTPAH
jgi:hypothetical protein